jgi:hypothetical protein
VVAGRGWPGAYHGGAWRRVVGKEPATHGQLACKGAGRNGGKAGKGRYADQIGGVDASGSFDQHDPAPWPGRARYGGDEFHKLGLTAASVVAHSLEQIADPLIATSRQREMRLGKACPRARNAIAQALSRAAGASKASSRRWMGGPRAIRTLAAFLGGWLPRNRVRAARKCYRVP